MRILLVLISLGVLCTATSYPRPLVVAHRGFSARAPENTLPAFLLAAESGADGIETDLQFTKDMQIVALHDTTLDRTTNCTGYLSNYTYAELSNCDASYVNGQNFEQFRGTKIPLFSEVVEQARNLSIFIVMDYKSGIPLGPALAQFVPNYTMTARVLGSCWEPWQIADIGENLPGSPKQMLTSGINYKDPSFWKEVIASRVNGFSIMFTNITKEFVAQAHESLLSVAVWTVNDPAMMHTALEYGVDAILTDDPPLLFQTIDEFNPPQTENYIGVHKWVVAAVAIAVFVVTGASAGVALYMWKRYSKYEKISRGNGYE